MHGLPPSIATLKPDITLGILRCRFSLALPAIQFGLVAIGRMIYNASRSLGYDLGRQSIGKHRLWWHALGVTSFRQIDCEFLYLV